MTTINAEVIAHSVCGYIDATPPLVTVKIRCPRFILAEINTHRVFSRNARSSRAVPIATMIREIEEDPVIPLHWGKNQKGMQADEECNQHIPFRSYLMKDSPVTEVMTREAAWLWARDRAVEAAQAFAEAGYHKQVVNRLLEPFMHVDVLITATQWDNFFLLRDHRDAEPHIRILAQVMRDAIQASKPRVIGARDMQWHLPYVTEDEYAAHGLEICRKLSVARCARISYAPFDGNASIDREIERYEALVGAEPRHSSPAEHQATPDLRKYGGGWERPDLQGNFTGWKQLRRYIDLNCEPHKSQI